MPQKTSAATTHTTQRAYYSAQITTFLEQSDAEVLAALAIASPSDIERTQRDAWLEQLAITRSALMEHRAGLIAFEFAVPRVGKRIDVLLVLQHVIFVIEFKVGETRFSAEAIEQVWDYALDLKNFHSTSHDKHIAPILVATGAATAPSQLAVTGDHDLVIRPMRAAPAQLASLIKQVLSFCAGPMIDAPVWLDGRYTPTPTIVEAAKALYGRHGVAEISRSDAAAINLSQTSSAISNIIRDAKALGRKSICFVTGVPGAGKTLVGLNIATQHMQRTSELYSVFLSGNGPLVAILCEALARDKAERMRRSGKQANMGETRSEVKAFVQNIHHFRDECLRDNLRPPIEHVALFDEAQRAWDQSKTAKFMLRRRRIADFAHSEPEFLISCMDRHPDWAVVVCLVGGGQEIHDGEAGIGEWIRAVVSSFPDWHVHISPTLHDSEYEAGRALSLFEGHKGVHENPSLHLGVSVRSFRAEHVSGLVKAILDRDGELAREILANLHKRYPIVLSRNLAAAKRWLRSQARGSERFGMIVSSQALRLKPQAIDVRVDVDPIHWFLGKRDDVRSSYYLEDAATEFQVQGLELDWACVVWDADLRHTSEGWHHWSFRGNRWQRVQSQQRQTYLRNAYRVLLTRARQGMVVVVPAGDPDDPTRSSGYYDGTYEYLREIGFAVIE